MERFCYWERLAGDRHYNSVLTIIRVLERKGHLRHRVEGKAHVYRARQQPERSRGRVLAHLIEQVFGGSAGLWIVRTAWLYGPPGNDFPDKIVAAADRLPEHEPLPVVADEFGSPTYTKDVAAAMFELLARTEGGVYHVADTGVASRRDWAERVLAVRRPGREARPISASEFSRASTPPRWGVLSSGRAAA